MGGKKLFPGIEFDDISGEITYDAAGDKKKLLLIKMGTGVSTTQIAMIS